MILPVMSFSKAVKPLALLAALGLLASPAAAQIMAEPDATEVAKTPLRDLNIDGRDIPEILQKAALAPYATAGMSRCNAIISEVAALDTALGTDYDIADGDGKDRISEGRIGQSVVGSFLPFRGILREVTGAAENDRTLRTAYTAGMARRSFLKGWGLGRGCAYPARPKAGTAGR